MIIIDHLSIRSPSPTINTVRRRSPSPIKTGVVNRARTRFETTGGYGYGYGDLGGGGGGGGHQTLPRAFKLGASSRVNLAEKTVAPKSGLSGSVRTSEPVVPSSYRGTEMTQGRVVSTMKSMKSIPFLKVTIQCGPDNGSAVLSTENGTNKRAEPITRQLRHCKMGLAIIGIELLSVEPIIGLLMYHQKSFQS